MERNLKNNPVGWTIILTAAILSAIVALGPNFVLRVGSLVLSGVIWGS